MHQHEAPKRLHEVAQPIFVSEVYILHENDVLMFKRSETKKKFPGFWSIPGGHIDEGEDPLAAAIREVHEETGISLTPDKMQLRVVAMHHHLDRGELYVAFAFTAQLDSLPAKLSSNEEGSAQWLPTTEVFSLENVFPPVKYYFSHIFRGNLGIVFNQSQWQDNQLVKVLSETVQQT